MNKLLILSCAALTGACTMYGTPDADRAAADDGVVAAALSNYTAVGPTVSCVNMRDLGGNRSAGEGAIIFDGPGRRAWVNRPAAGCPVLSYGRALQTRTTSTQLCRGDIATVFDPSSGVQYGACALGDFQPYERNPRSTR